MPEQITDAFVLDLANAIDVHQRTLVRRLAGLPVRGRTGIRIDRALAARGIKPGAIYATRTLTEPKPAA